MTRARDGLLEWKRYGTLAVASAIGFSFVSFMSPAIGLFMAPLQHEFGWSRAFLSAGPAVGAGLSLLLSPAFGALVDRIGSRRLALAGIVATALAISAFSFLDGARAGWIACWAAFGVTSLSIHATTWTSAVARAFRSSRGLALGFTLAGSAAASAIVPPLANALIERQGWRAAYVWLGLGWGSVALVLAALFLVDAGGTRATPLEQQDPAGTPARGLTPREAWRSSALWRVGLATFLILTITIAITVHQVPILVSAGVTADNAAWLASLAGLAGIVGKVVTGSLLDRFHVRWIGGLTLASTAIAYPLLLEPMRSPALIVVAMMINGYAAGTKLQLCGYLTASYGGMRHYGAIFGVMASLIALAGGVGPVVAGAIFDRTGDYDLFLMAGTIVSLVSGVLVFSLGAYPDWESPE